ncbi:MAG: glycoside hydrolase [Oligoflexales bacterium]|nr:glycoside hydrolase [Oligoflexales bacterium]
MSYLYQISGSKTLSGMHNRHNKSPRQYSDKIGEITGRYPALWSADFLFESEDIENRSTMTKEAIVQWKAGALINLMWHACNPAISEPCTWNEGEGPRSYLNESEWQELITGGTQLNNRWKKQMDQVAYHLKNLEMAGVEVLFRPLHEMNQGAFWWGGRPGPSGTRRLYQLTHDYFTKDKGLKNLIWIWDVQDFDTLKDDLINYNPGSEYWDVAALDIYQGYATWKYTAMVSASQGKPIAIGECAQLPDPELLRLEPKWTFFMSWSELTFEYNSEEKIRNLYNDQNVITRNRLKYLTPL